MIFFLSNPEPPSRIFAMKTYIHIPRSEATAQRHVAAALEKPLDDCRGRCSCVGVVFGLLAADGAASGWL
jgi:hypothetical protein